ncbi:TetR/AcrR family transcriptional regulator C-terminal domain-containing protein [Microbispora sp. NPDC049125]|uniref:TetR/AcrR family transcriptional regulator C-terminal domain-containing protein n=1 Tax=Microbispora sp. NPDC049125 TaxID=3154929 RepID=UPI003465CEDD
MDRTTIVNAALELLNEVGLEGVTVRRLAADLGVQNPALYWHFPNKQALLDEMAQVLQARQDFGPPHPGESWQLWLTRRGRERRRILLSHRDGARLVAGTRPGPDLLLRFEAELAALVANGFTAAQALRAIGTLSRYVNGFVLDEQALPRRRAEPDEPADKQPVSDQPADVFQATPTLAAAIRDSGDSDETFEDGLRILIDGIAAGLKRRQDGTGQDPASAAPGP